MKKFTSGFILLVLLLLPARAQAATLIPGGQVVGIRLGDPMTVAAFDPAGSPARDAGLQIGDRITYINDTNVTTVQGIRQALEKSDGAATVRYERQGAPHTVSIKPRNGQLGIYMKNCVSGIGTVTYYRPEDNRFGALGHGVNDRHGNLQPMDTGNAYDAWVLSVKTGAVGDPGKLIGSLGKPIGSLEKNTSRGIFGTVNNLPDLPTLETAPAKTGDACIRSTVNGQRLQEYSVKILKIYPGDRADGRNMLLQITDPALLSATGGIVQGMSGSPIIQDGKLVGAVTHVLVNDPTTGYGIFIENMLDAAA